MKNIDNEKLVFETLETSQRTNDFLISIYIVHLLTRLFLCAERKSPRKIVFKMFRKRERFLTKRKGFSKHVRENHVCCEKSHEKNSSILLLLICILKSERRNEHHWPFRTIKLNSVFTFFTFK